MSPHRETFVNLVKRHGWTRGAELGVDKGLLFERLLSEVKDLALIGVDTCPVPHRKARCESIALAYSVRADLMVARTVDAARAVEDASLDFVFIDADHSYESVKEDIEHWEPKVRKGGWVGGHDYNRQWPGVVRAVDERYGIRVNTYKPGSIWGAYV